MATSAALAYAPPAGTYLEETAMPVGVDQLVLPDALTWDGTDYIGAQGSYTVWEVDSGGLATAEAVTIAAPTTVSIEAAYAPGAGREYVTLTSWAGDASFATTPVAGDQIEYPDSIAVAADGTVTGADGTYTLRHIVSATGVASALEYTIGAEQPVDPVDPEASTASVSVAYGPGELWNYATITQALTSPGLFAAWSRLPLIGEQLLALKPNNWTNSGDYQTLSEGMQDVILVSDDGIAYALQVDATGLPTATTQPPAGVVTFAEVVATPDSINGTFDYSASDATGFRGRINNGEWSAITSPFSFTGLEAESAYSIDVQPFNGNGDGGIFTLTETTQPVPLGSPIVAVTVPAAGVYTVGDMLAFTVTWDDAVTVTGGPVLLLSLDGEQRSANFVSGSGTAVLVFNYTVQAGDNAADGVQLTVVALNGGEIADSESRPAGLQLAGVGDTSGVIVDAVPPAITIGNINTFSTAPLASGQADDAVSLSLVVNGVTYSPSPVNGIWSQQLPELALGPYEMTLTGVDGAGNESDPATATLNIRERPPTADRGMFRPIFRRPAGSLSSTLFR
ncbi:hypothetical protein [uncultured Marinobacter sp.]|uniref:hypothetical protein n=1 Tax=uncultured Marinobacter sp. TaxID=187379 RepID=UPI0030DC1194